jgi:hypothetical protein
MLAAVGDAPDSWCTACWTGDYREPITEGCRQAELFPIRVEEGD